MIQSSQARQSVELWPSVQRRHSTDPALCALSHVSAGSRHTIIPHEATSLSPRNPLSPLSYPSCALEKGLET